MACDISMNEAAPIAVHHQGYIPRNAIDHMNPFFFKSHQHTHSHAHYGHSHGHHNHPSSHHPIRQQPYTAPSHTHTTTASSKNKDTSPDTHPSSASTTSPSPVDLQTPVPRRMSAQIDPLTLLNTPPATPPLTVLSQKQYPSNVPSTTPASILRSSTNTSTAASSKEDKDEVEDKADPLAWCAARARIPTPDGSEYFLHIYENKQDKKEHLAFVFGDAIRSRTLDRVQPNETEMDRLRRGAYTGRLQNMVDADQQPPSGPFRTATATATTTATATATVTVTTETVVEFDKDQDTVMESTTTEVEASMSTTSTMASSVASAGAAPLVRIHSECFTGEIGHSARCDCGEQLDEAIRLMKAQGCGVVVYLRQEGRGIGLGEKLKAYNLQDLGYDTVMANLLLNHGADERTYEVAQAILQDLGLDQIRLLTNNPDKIEQVEKNSSIRVVERVPMMPKSWEAIQQGTEGEFEVKEGAVENKIVKGKELDKYLKVKVERMRHLIPIPTSL